MNGPTIRSTASSGSTSARISPRALARSTIPRTTRRRGSTRCSENSACISGSPVTSDSSRGISVSAPVRAAPASTACAVAAKSPDQRAGVLRQRDVAVEVHDRRRARAPPWSRSGGRASPCRRRSARARAPSSARGSRPRRAARARRAGSPRRPRPSAAARAAAPGALGARAHAAHGLRAPAHRALARAAGTRPRPARRPARPRPRPAPPCACRDRTRPARRRRAGRRRSRSATASAARERVVRDVARLRGQGADGRVHVSTVAAGQERAEHRDAERAAGDAGGVVDRRADAHLGLGQRAHDRVGGGRHRRAPCRSRAARARRRSGRSRTSRRRA